MTGLTVLRSDGSRHQAGAGKAVSRQGQRLPDGSRVTYPRRAWEAPQGQMQAQLHGKWQPCAVSASCPRERLRVTPAPAGCAPGLALTAPAERLLLQQVDAPWHQRHTLMMHKMENCLEPQILS